MLVICTDISADSDPTLVCTHTHVTESLGFSPDAMLWNVFLPWWCCTGLATYCCHHRCQQTGIHTHWSLWMHHWLWRRLLSGALTQQGSQPALIDQDLGLLSWGIHRTHATDIKTAVLSCPLSVANLTLWIIKGLLHLQGIARGPLKDFSQWKYFRYHGMPNAYRLTTTIHKRNVTTSVHHSWTMHILWSYG